MSVSANDKVNVAVIGLGWPGQRHLDGYATIPFVHVGAICDMSDVLLESTRAQRGIARAVREYEAVLAMPEIDAVSVCLPNWLHVPASIAAIAAGKHVLCEKPLANTLAEGERLAAAVHANDRIFMLALNNRFRAEMQALKHIVDAGEMGQIYFGKTGWVRRRVAGITRGWFMQKDRSGGGPMIDLGVHMLDLTLWLMGNPKATRVSGAVYDLLFREMRDTLGPIDVEDFAAAMIHLDNGATITLETSWVSYIEKELIFSELLGTKGGAKYERSTDATGPQAGHAPPFTLYGTIGGEQVNAVPTGIPLTPEQMLLTSFANETRHFAECVRDDTEPLATVDQGLEILRILDAVYRSAAEGREISLTDAGSMQYAVHGTQ